MSDEQPNDGAPDGETPHDRADGNGELARVIEQRDQHKEAVRERDQQLAAVRAELAEARAAAPTAAPATTTAAPPTAAPATPPGAPDWAQNLIAQVAQLKQEIAGGAAKTARTDLIAQVLNGVPDGNRASTELAVLGLEAKGLITLDTGGSADAVNAAIHEHSPNLFRDGRRRVRLPPQTTATGAVDWSGYQSITEVPKELIRQVPNSEWDRLNKTGDGAGQRKLNL